MMPNIAIGSDDRIIAEARPSAASARTLRRILKRCRMTAERFSRISLEVAAGRALDRDRGDEQRQVVLADAEIEIAHRAFEIGAVGDFVGDDAEFGADGIGAIRAPTMVIATGTGWPARRLRTMMSSASGKLRAEFLLPAAAQMLQHRQRPERQQEHERRPQ